jgi:hypothetical protein
MIRDPRPKPWTAVLVLATLTALFAPTARPQDAVVQPSHTRTATPAPAAPAPAPAAPAPAAPKARAQTPSSPIGITVQVVPVAPTVYINWLWPPLPNPVSGSTVIRYSLAKPSYVSIRVYSITGQQAAKLVEWHHDAGNYSLRWEGTGPQGRLAPGVYIYRMVAGSYVKSQRLILVR